MCLVQGLQTDPALVFIPHVNMFIVGLVVNFVFYPWFMIFVFVSVLAGSECCNCNFYK